MRMKREPRARSTVDEGLDDLRLARLADPADGAARHERPANLLAVVDLHPQLSPRLVELLEVAPRVRATLPARRQARPCREGGDLDPRVEHLLDGFDVAGVVGVEECPDEIDVARRHLEAVSRRAQPQAPGPRSAAKLGRSWLSEALQARASADLQGEKRRWPRGTPARAVPHRLARSGRGEEAPAPE